MRRFRLFLDFIVRVFQFHAHQGRHVAAFVGREAGADDESITFADDGLELRDALRLGQVDLTRADGAMLDLLGRERPDEVAGDEAGGAEDDDALGVWWRWG